MRIMTDPLLIDFRLLQQYPGGEPNDAGDPGMFQRPGIIR